MSAIYYFCSGGTVLAPTTVTLSGGTCGACQTSQNGECELEECYIDLKFTLSVSATTEITINYSNDWSTEVHWSGGGGGSYENSGTTTTNTTVIPSGSTTHIITRDCSETENCVGDQYDDTEINEWDNWTLLDQVELPACNVSTCALAITGTSTTQCSSRGAADGTATCSISGYTGSIVFKIDGVTKTVGAYTGYTFTGLLAGEHVIRVQSGTTPTCFDQETVIVLDGAFRTGDFIVKTPNELVFSDSPVVINIGSAINSASPLQAKMTLEVADTTIPNGYTIDFELTSPFIYNKTFTAKGFPNKSEYWSASVITNESGVSVDSNDRAEIVTSLAEAFQNDAVLPKVYYINSDETSIYFTAKEMGSNYNLNSGNVSFSETTGVTISSTQAGLNAYDGQSSENYNIWIEVFVDNTDLQYPNSGATTDYVRLAELELPFSQDNVHKFDVASILKTQVTTPKPFNDFTGYTIQPSAMASYKIKYGEKYPLIENSNTSKKRVKDETGIMWCYNGALNRYLPNNLSGYTATIRAFLTNSPSPKLIQRQSEEFLYFIIPANLGYPIKLMGDMEFWDGTSVSGVTFFDIATGTTNAGGLAILNLSYDKMGLENYENTGTTVRKIKNVEVAVYYESGATDVQYTEKKQYHFEIEDKPRKFGIHFQSELAYDSFDFIGIVEETIDRKSGTYTVPMDIANDGSVGQGFKSTATYDTRVTKKLTCNSGWIDQEHFNWLIELLESNNIYSYTTTNQNYLNVTGHKYKKSSLDDLYDMEVTFIQTIYENNISV